MTITADDLTMYDCFGKPRAITKRCNACGEVKELGEFHELKSSKDGRQPKCKECAKTYMRSRRLKDGSRLQKFGISKREFERRLAQQGGRCLGCGETGNDWHLDHDHSCCPGQASCGKCIRGILCRGCNTALGFMEDCPDLLVALANYLKHPPINVTELMQAQRDEYDARISSARPTSGKYDPETYPYDLPTPKKDSRECSYHTCTRTVEYSKIVPLCGGHYLQLRRGVELFELGSRRRPAKERNGRGEKWCPTHEGWVAEAEFNKSTKSPDGLGIRCRTCSRKMDSPEKARDRRLWRNYRLTSDMVDELMALQGGCAACGAQEANWHVDHNHACCPDKTTCGKCVRGVLCKRCNQALGLVNDSQGILLELVRYLAEYDRVSR